MPSSKKPLRLCTYFLRNAVTVPRQLINTLQAFVSRLPYRRLKSKSGQT